MLKQAKDMVVELREKMRDGNGTVEIMHIFPSNELKGKCRMFAKITLQPGCSIGLHAHVEEEEVYYILQGKGRVEDGGKVFEVNAGDAVLTGDGASHAIENISQGSLEMLAVVLLYK